MKKEIVAFDFDGTLTTRDSLLCFIQYVHGTTALVTGFLRYLPLLLLMKLHLYPNYRAKEKIFSHFFRGMDARTFSQWGERFAKDRHSLLRPAGVQSIKNAINCGDTVVIVSASIDQWVQPFFPDVTVLGTQPEIKDGKLTGRFLTKNCYGQEKVERFLQLFPDRDSYRLTAYGDSRGDRELLAFADEAHYKPFRS